MKNSKKHLSIITSEAVGIGHPDKICDQIADKILETCLASDPNSRVACEVFASNHLIVIGGEITTKSYVDVVACAWQVLLPLGYSENDFTILSNINSQSIEINQKINKQKNHLGAGDMAVVYGYATNETKDYLPIPYLLATLFIAKINKLTKTKKLLKTKFDSKCQVSVYYDDDFHPIGIDNVIVSLQHDKDANLDELKKQILNEILIPIAKNYHMNDDFDFFLNQNGSFILGGPFGDTGLTGRKLMTDTYGTIAHHGGGAFSGKDYTKVDRSGAYFARYIAKNLVASGVADRLEIQLAFNIGNELPISLFINAFNTNKIELEKIYKIINDLFSLKLVDIVNQFDMKNIKYSNYSVYGHFTNQLHSAPWEQLDKVEEIKKYLSNSD